MKKSNLQKFIKLEALSFISSAIIIIFFIILNFAGNHQNINHDSIKNISEEKCEMNPGLMKKLPFAGILHDLAGEFPQRPFLIKNNLILLQLSGVSELSFVYMVTKYFFLILLITALAEIIGVPLIFGFIYLQEKKPPKPKNKKFYFIALFLIIYFFYVLELIFWFPCHPILLLINLLLIRKYIVYEKRNKLQSTSMVQISDK
ncbi:MAG: hypothetical protein MJB14_17515 [Spirochaetes bacterium]|nr:hypothetical protein [Spirochaetota bacterium]